MFISLKSELNISQRTTFRKTKECFYLYVGMSGWKFSRIKGLIERKTHNDIRVFSGKTESNHKRVNKSSQALRRMC
jgi:hypothetical protein